MISVLVVDDEKIAGEQISYILEHNFGGEISVVTVSNGYKALEMVNEKPPDILLTDIKMPKMDGIVLAEKVREILPEIKIIFTTAYADKEVLKSAIKIRPVSFVEKPIITEELVSAVQKAARLVEQSEKSFSFNHSHMVLSMCKKDFDKKMLAAIDYSLCTKLEKMSFKSVLIKCIPEAETTSLGQADILNSLAGMLSSRNLDCFYAFKSTDVIVMNFYFSDCDSIENDIAAFLNDFINEVENYNFLCCMGKKVNSFNELYLSYEEASICLEQSFFSPELGVMSMKQFGDDRDKKTSGISEFYNLIKSGDKDGAYRVIDELYSSLIYCKNTLVSEAKSYYVDIVNQIFMFARDYNIKFHELYRLNDAITTVMSSQWIVSVNSYVCDLLQKLFVSTDVQGRDYSLAQKVIDYIGKRYRDPTLSVSNVAEYCSLTPSYVNSVFKNNTGVTINTYINELRMNRAKVMLMNTNETLDSIALSSGYSSSNYFCKIFKKYMGMTPSEYKKQEKQNNKNQ